jgi:DNA-binding NarL/FixJ family response regulator
MRILIVEDEALVALDMAMILQAAGYQIIGTKPTGDSALAALKTAEAENLLPDLILMDIALRGALDGIETTKQIKTAYAGIPIVFVTGQADPATRTRAETTAPAGYLLKPFTPEQLVGFVNSVLTR